MITNRPLEVVRGPDCLVLAPFDKDHLAEVLPLDESLLGGQPAVSKPYYTAEDPSLLLHDEVKHIHTETWGIFSAKRSHGLTAPERFLGEVSLTKHLLGEDDNLQASVLAQETGTQLFSSELLGRGIGTLARLAIIAQAFSEGMHMVSAQVSPLNVRSQRSLAKTGFVKLDTLDETKEYIYGGHQQSQVRYLMSQEAVAVNEGQPDFALLAAGRQVYEHATKELLITEL